MKRLSLAYLDVVAQWETMAFLRRKNKLNIVSACCLFFPARYDHRYQELLHPSEERRITEDSSGLVFTGTFPFSCLLPRDDNVTDLCL